MKLETKFSVCASAICVRTELWRAVRRHAEDVGADVDVRTVELDQA